MNRIALFSTILGLCYQFNKPSSKWSQTPGSHTRQRNANVGFEKVCMMFETHSLGFKKHPVVISEASFIPDWLFFIVPIKYHPLKLEVGV